MPAASAQYDMPKTPQGAPPSFYNQAAGMAQTGGGAAAAPPPPPAANADTQKFLEMTDKLLTVLGSMQAMKPNGIDVTKFTQAAADSIKKCVESVKGGETDQPAGTDPSAGQSGQLPGDQTGGSQGAAAAQ